MRELEDANLLHKPDSYYNKNVNNQIKVAKRAKNPRDYIDYLAGAKDWTQIEERTEWELSNESNKQNNQNSTNEYIEDVIDKNINLVVEEVVEEEER